LCEQARNDRAGRKGERNAGKRGRSWRHQRGLRAAERETRALP
jgi:hypothetical protein